MKRIIFQIANKTQSNNLNKNDLLVTLIGKIKNIE